jgi:hypothetical protein
MSVRQPLPATILALVTCAAALSPPAARAAELVLTNAPGSNWIVDGAADSCRMTRDLGEGENRVTLLLSQWSPGKSFSLTLAGRPLRRFDDRRPITLQFGDAAGPLGPRPAEGVKGSLGDNGDALIISSAYLTAPPPEGPGRSPWTAEFGSAAPMLAPAAIAAADRIELVQGRDTLRLQPSRLSDALTLLDDCSQLRLPEWGLDAAAHRTMIQQAEALNYRDLAARVSRYYPAAAAMRGEQGNLHMRMLVDENGTATDCTIVATTQASRITTKACEHFTQEALFLPALDAAGRPMKSFYTTAILFRMQPRR